MRERGRPNEPPGTHKDFCIRHSRTRYRNE
nr:MAG TPA: hypothetical protein [Caudoviricetes sp.]